MPALLTTELFVILIGACDEWNQSHIDGRYGDPVDILIDAGGALVMLVIFGVIMYSKEQKGAK